MRSFDAFSRPNDEFAVKTTSGGYLSVCSLVLMSMLFFSELTYFMKKETKDQMVIDQNQDKKTFDFSFNITFPKVPCIALGVNLVDPKSANVMHVSTHIYKTRLSKNGIPIGKRLRDGLSSTAVHPQDVLKAETYASDLVTLHSTSHLRCPSCFGSSADDDDCCETCHDIRERFANLKTNETRSDYVFGQCHAEVYTANPPQKGEGCHIEASLRSKKTGGSLHIGLPKSLKSALLAEPKKEMNFNFMHAIHGLSFGPDFPGLVRVLDGRQAVDRKHSNTDHYHYRIHVIPTRFADVGQEEIVSHQYSVTEYYKEVQLYAKTSQGMIVGVEMMYDFTPFEVQVTRSRKNFLLFLTECCAILGGIFAFTGMLDKLLYQFGHLATGRQKKSILN